MSQKQNLQFAEVPKDAICRQMTDAVIVQCQTQQLGKTLERLWSDELNIIAVQTQHLKET